MNNVPIAVGDYLYPGDNPGNNQAYKKVERLQDGRWEIMGDFPFADCCIYSYSLVTFQRAIIIFGKIFNFDPFLKIKFNLGGMVDGSYSNLAAKMDETGIDRNIWSNMGRLLSRRNHHRSIVLHNKIVHVGGNGKK